MRSARARELERCAVRKRKDDFAPPLDPNALDIAARSALEVEDEVDGLFDVGPVEGRERRIGGERRRSGRAQAERSVSRASGGSGPDG